MAALRRLDVGRLAILGVLLIGTVVIFTKDQWDWIFADGEAETTDVDAPTIDVDDVDDETQRLYRIGPDNGGPKPRHGFAQQPATTADVQYGTR